MSVLKLPQTDKGKSFKVHSDDIIVIRLEENPTTGYRWEVDKADDEILTLQSSDFSLAEGPRIGGGGMRIFILKAKSAGTAHIELKHWRKWEGEDSVIKRFDVTIMVRD